MAQDEIPRLDLQEVERLQAELLQLVDDLGREPDAERQGRLIKQISERSDRLQETCTALESRARAAARELRGELEVELTAEQQAELKRRTGVVMTRVSIPDQGGVLAPAMPNMTREAIMTYAIFEAERRQREDAAREAARNELARIREDLKDAPEQVRQEIERLLADPEFRRAFADPPRRR